MSDLLSHIDTRQEEMLAFLEQLVNMDSGTLDKAGVDRVGEVLASRLEALGFSVARVPQREYGDHLVGRKRGTGGRRILFVGHMDTVFPAGTAATRSFRVADGLAYGPGVADMKGGLVVLLTALGALKATDTGVFDALDMTVVFNSDEEVLSPTSRPIIEAEARLAHAACIFEPARPGGEYVIARKGVGKYLLTVHGRAAHAGTQPEQGRSAILEMAHKIVSLHGLTDLASGIALNVGVVRGGERSNVVAEEASAEVDVRVTSLQAADLLEQRIRQVAARSTVPDTTADLEGALYFPPMVQTAGSSLLFEMLQSAGRQLGLDLEGIATGGGSDGNHTAQFTPTVDGMGPRGSDAHSDREHMDVSSLTERTKVAALFLKTWARGD